MLGTKLSRTEVDTGNILTNSTFGTGDTTTTTGWSTSGDDGIHTHGAWNGDFHIKQVWMIAVEY